MGIAHFLTFHYIISIMKNSIIMFTVTSNENIIDLRNFYCQMSLYNSTSMSFCEVSFGIIAIAQLNFGVLSPHHDNYRFMQV